jgi:hypothetical protein
MQKNLPLSIVFFSKLTSESFFCCLVFVLFSSTSRYLPLLAFLVCPIHEQVHMCVREWDGGVAGGVCPSAADQKRRTARVECAQLLLSLSEHV